MIVLLANPIAGWCELLRAGLDTGSGGARGRHASPKPKLPALIRLPACPSTPPQREVA